MKNLNLLVWLTQLGLSTAIPLGGFIVLAVWLRSTFSLGGWVIGIGLVLGLTSAVYGFRGAVRTMRMQMREEKEQEPPAAFNDHD